jgi:hypothetical protein
MDLLESTVSKLLKIYLDECSKFLPLDHWRTGVDQKFSGGKRVRNPNKGFSDIMVIFCGLAVCIEAKRSKGGKVSDDQLSFCDRVVGAGGMYFIVRSVTELKQCLQGIVLQRLPTEFAEEYLQVLQMCEDHVQSKHKKYFPSVPSHTSEPEVDIDNVVEFPRYLSRGVASVKRDI